DQDAFSTHANSLLRNAQAGPEPSPVLDQIVDPPDGEQRVDDQEPFVDDAVIAANLALRVFLDLAVSRMTLRLRVAHVQPPIFRRSTPRRAGPGAGSIRRPGRRPSSCPTGTRRALPAPSTARPR